MSNTASSLSDFDEGGVGLANPDLSGRRRVLLDLINRLHSTGYVKVVPCLCYRS